MYTGDEGRSVSLDELELDNFVQRFPWIGGDLQTLRDTFVADYLPEENGEPIKIPIPKMPCGAFGSGNLLAFLDRPKSENIRGLVLMLHGLGGSSRRRGLRRMSFALLKEGFAVLRLNLRGADPGRELAGGTYAAKCNSDLIPVISYAREICNQLSAEKLPYKSTVPLLGVGISLGGTILLNACLESDVENNSTSPILDGLVCISSPLELAICSKSIERPRNFIYQRWLLNRLINQTLADPFGITNEERNKLINLSSNRSKNSFSIRSFDAAITAPRWGFLDVDDYYNKASPLYPLLNQLGHMPKMLFIQAIDDPWVPYEPTLKLANNIASFNAKWQLEVFIIKRGGHNGFHGIKGCWGDDCVKRWLVKLTN